MKVVSLIASSTEMICAMGFQKNLVGRSHECDFPVEVQKLPACSKPRFPVEGDSREIDDRVKEVLRQGLPLYEIHQELLRSLRPDVIVTQDHCEVCAVSLKDVQALCGLLDPPPQIVTLKPDSLNDIWLGMRRIAEALGEVKKGEDHIQQLKSRMQAIEQKAKALNQQPHMVCLEWLNPLMAGGNWVPEMVSMLNATSSFGKAGKHSPYLDWNALLSDDPEYLVVMPCGWDIAKARCEMKFLTQQPGWPSLKAVRNGKVFLTDGNQYFNRPGPRVVESLEILAEILYPNVFHFGHEGQGWERF